MKYIICYDVSEDKVRRVLVTYLESFAYRVQGSVFVCDLAPHRVKRVWGMIKSLTSGSVCRRLLLAPVANEGENLWMEGQPIDTSAKEEPRYILI